MPDTLLAHSASSEEGAEVPEEGASPDSPESHETGSHMTTPASAAVATAQRSPLQPYSLNDPKKQPQSVQAARQRWAIFNKARIQEIFEATLSEMTSETTRRSSSKSLGNLLDSSSKRTDTSSSAPQQEVPNKAEVSAAGHKRSFSGTQVNVRECQRSNDGEGKENNGAHQQSSNTRSPEVTASSSLGSEVSGQDNTTLASSTLTLTSQVAEGDTPVRAPHRTTAAPHTPPSPSAEHTAGHSSSSSGECSVVVLTDPSSAVRGHHNKGSSASSSSGADVSSSSSQHTAASAASSSSCTAVAHSSSSTLIALQPTTHPSTNSPPQQNLRRISVDSSASSSCEEGSSSVRAPHTPCPQGRTHKMVQWDRGSPPSSRTPGNGVIMMDAPSDMAPEVKDESCAEGTRDTRASKPASPKVCGEVITGRRGSSQCADSSTTKPAATTRNPPRADKAAKIRSKEQKGSGRSSAEPRGATTRGNGRKTAASPTTTTTTTATSVDKDKGTNKKGEKKGRDCWVALNKAMVIDIVDIAMSQCDSSTEDVSVAGGGRAQRRPSLLPLHHSSMEEVIDVESSRDDSPCDIVTLLSGDSDSQCSSSADPAELSGALNLSHSGGGGGRVSSSTRAHSELVCLLGGPEPQGTTPSLTSRRSLSHAGKRRAGPQGKTGPSHGRPTAAKRRKPCQDPAAATPVCDQSQGDPQCGLDLRSTRAQSRSDSMTSSTCEPGTAVLRTLLARTPSPGRVPSLTQGVAAVTSLPASGDCFPARSPSCSPPPPPPLPSQERSTEPVQCSGGRNKNLGLTSSSSNSAAAHKCGSASLAIDPDSSAVSSATAASQHSSKVTESTMQTQCRPAAAPTDPLPASTAAKTGHSSAMVAQSGRASTPPSGSAGKQMKRRSVRSASHESPKYGWVALSKADVHTIVDSVMTRMFPFTPDEPSPGSVGSLSVNVKATAAASSQSQSTSDSAHHQVQMSQLLKDKSASDASCHLSDNISPVQDLRHTQGHSHQTSSQDHNTPPAVNTLRQVQSQLNASLCSCVPSSAGTKSGAKVGTRRASLFTSVDQLAQSSPPDSPEPRFCSGHFAMQACHRPFKWKSTMMMRVTGEEGSHGPEHGELSEDVDQSSVHSHSPSPTL